MTHEVVLSARARTQLRELFQYIASEASPDIAKSYTDAIVNHVRSLGEFPNRGTPHDDIRPGVRTIPFRGA
jgi:toxin ParE1/3/4